MSLIVFMETDTGLILAGDSRLSRKDDPDWHNDNAEKIFDCKNKVGIAYHGDANINGEPMDQIIRDFIFTVNETDTIKDIFRKMQAFIKAKGTPESSFYILGYENTERKIYKFNVHDNLVENISDTVHGTGGNDEVAWPILRGKFDIHKTNKEAIQLVFHIYHKTMDSMNTVGGAIDILFISNDGLTWIKNKHKHN